LAGDASGSSPVIRALLVVEVPNAGDKRRMPLLLGPVDGVVLRSCRVEDVTGMVLDDVILDRRAWLSTLWTGFNEDVSHVNSFRLSKCATSGWSFPDALGLWKLGLLSKLLALLPRKFLMAQKVSATELVWLIAEAMKDEQDRSPSYPTRKRDGVW
jgi:hypothetical protein